MEPVTKEEDEARSAAAAVLGRKGGEARAKALTKKERSEASSKAARARWKKAVKKVGKKKSIEPVLFPRKRPGS